MIQNILSFLLTVLLCSFIAIVATNFIVRAGNLGGPAVTVMATIQPHRIIVVDKSLTIMTILSNTAQDVRPIVFLSALDGKQLPYSESIIEQYMALKPSLVLDKPGVVYEKGNAPIINIFNQGVAFFQALL